MPQIERLQVSISEPGNPRVSPSSRERTRRGVSKAVDPHSNTLSRSLEDSDLDGALARQFWARHGMDSRGVEDVGFPSCAAI
jgi:hypothetical protein